MPYFRRRSQRLLRNLSLPPARPARRNPDGRGDRRAPLHRAVRVHGRLTQTNNHLKDLKCDEPRILELRALHETMDRAVVDSYGWTVPAVPPICPSTPEQHRAVEQFQDAVIDRLFVLNAQRADEEKRLGAAKASKATKSKKLPVGPKATATIKEKPAAGQDDLFGSNVDQ